MTYLFLSIFLAVFIHLCSMAAVARLFGIKVNAISIGYGPKIFKFESLTINLLPFGGNVRMQDSRVDFLEESEHAHSFDQKNRLIRALIPLSGCFSLFLASFFFLGNMTILELFSGFRQIISGALHPISVGSTFITNAISFVNNSEPTVVFSIVTIKLCALNLLPFPTLNGGQIIIELLDLPEQINKKLFDMSIMVYLLFLISWVLAIFVSLWQ